MIDRVLSAKAKDVFSNDYQAKNAITSSRLINPEAPRLVVVFPPWGGGGYLTQTLVNRLLPQSAVLEYGFHHQIIEPNTERVKQSFGTIQETIIQDINKLEYDSVDFIGLSLGNVALALVAKEFPNFKKATMVTVGSSLADAVWEGLRGRMIKNSFSEQGITKDMLVETWQALAPINHVTAFSGKDVDLVISKADKIIPTAHQIEMADKLNAVGSNLSISYSRPGHVLTLSRFCMRQSKIET